MPTLAAAIDAILGFCILFLVVHVVISWLIGDEVISTGNPRVAAMRGFFVKVTNPALRRFRLLSADTGDVDMTPIILIVLLLAARYVLKLYPMM